MVAYALSNLALRASPTPDQGSSQADLDRRKTVLMVAFESGRWALTRLVRPLSEQGLRVVALCAPDNALTACGWLHAAHPLPNVRSRRQFARRLAAAARIDPPDLILPGDERAVACLQALVRDTHWSRRVGLNGSLLEVIRRSLGSEALFPAMLLKPETIALAHRLGIRTPETRSAATLVEARAAAADIGYPVFLKSGFSWAGQGVRRCDTEADLDAAFGAGGPRPEGALRRRLRRLLGRDWYPHPASVEIQQAINGQPAMVAAAAMDGRTLSDFFGEALETTSATGPSSRVRIGWNAEAQSAARKMIAAFGCSGFVGFDFMIDRRTDAVYLIECNPRAIPVTHLGARIGADLAGALAGALHGAPTESTVPERREVVAMFPQSWLRSPADLKENANYIDAPWDDPSLMRAMMASPTALEQQQSQGARGARGQH
jgi:biotin carboxylase